MAAVLSARSKGCLSLVHADLRMLVHSAAAEGLQFEVICGHRGKVEQDRAFAAKKSKLQWPKSKHNKLPSLAVDVIRRPIDWADWRGQIAFAKEFLQIAEKIGVKVRWGGDWNSNGRSDDEKFLDLVHFELITD